MAKKKPKNKASNSSLTSFFKTTSLILFLISVCFIGYLFFYENKEIKNTEINSTAKPKEIQVKQEKTIINAINSYNKDKNLNKNFNDIFKEIEINKDKECRVDKPNCLPTKEISAFGDNVKAIKISEEITEKPKLAIIIDDVATKSESDTILQIIKKGKNITPSFFPNTSNHPDTNIYAKDFSHFMIHLPLRAINFAKEEPLTLIPTDSYEKIDERIKNIKKAFPKLKFLNNHTGSAFTSDEIAMRNLFKALKKYNLIFVDSRTIASTKAPVLAKEFNQFYIHRNIFLDNDQNIEAIKKKLDESVEFAIKHKRAIAIGHPHQTTLKAISEYDFSKVKLVFIDDIYDDYK